MEILNGQGRRGRAFVCMFAGLLGAAALSSAAPSSAAPPPFSAPQLKAAYLYRFAGYVEWPRTQARNAHFTIVVMGSPAVAQSLRELLPTHPIHDLPAQVREITNIHQLGDAQMLYLSSGLAQELRRVNEAAFAAAATLVVTDEEGGLDSGSMLNFLVVDNHVRFEVSLTAAERSGLKISSELLAVALHVQGSPKRSDDSATPSWSPLQEGPFAAASASRERARRIAPSRRRMPA